MIVVEYDPPQTRKDLPLPANPWGRIGALLLRGAGRAWWLLRLTLVGVALTPLALFGMLALASMANAYPTSCIAACWLCIVAVFACGSAYEAGLERRNLNSIEATPLDELDSTLGVLVRRGRLYLTTRFCARLVARLREAGHVGKTIYVCPRGQACVPPPIPVPFEHRALNEFDTAFEELRRSVSEAWDAGGQPTPPLDKRRLPVIAGAALLAIFLVGLPAILIGTRRMVAFAGLVIVLLTVVVGGVKSLNMIRRHAARRSATRPIPAHGASWRIANAAIVLATPGAGTRDWDLAVLAREHSTLVVLQRTPGHPSSVIAGSSEVFDSRAVSKIELDMLLRAWLSPIPPPTIEQFSDWTGTGARP